MKYARTTNLKLTLPMAPGTLYLLNRWYHWSILNKIHAYITHLTRECQFQWGRTFMNVVIATQTAERWQEAERTVYPVLSAYLTNQHGRILEVCHQHSLIRWDIPTLMQTNYSTIQEHTNKINTHANTKQSQVRGSCGSKH